MPPTLVATRDPGRASVPRAGSGAPGAWRASIIARRRSPTRPTSFTLAGAPPAAHEEESP
jgi:hypothetical protein